MEFIDFDRIDPKDTGHHVLPEMATLIQTKDNFAKICDYESKLKKLCSRIVLDLDNCTNEDKKDAYAYLDLKTAATPDGVDIKG
jgi:site-specific DNA recombinase